MYYIADFAKNEETPRARDYLSAGMRGGILGTSLLGVGWGLSKAASESTGKGARAAIVRGSARASVIAPLGITAGALGGLTLYGLNRYRKTRKDKGKKRGKYNT